MYGRLPAEFLKRKRDFSPLLVHLTRDNHPDSKEPQKAKEVLERILLQRKLRAFSPYCLFNSEIEADKQLKDMFKVVCFTETPLDLVDTLIMPLEGRSLTPQPYGLVFTKEFVKQKGGNPVFYVSRGLFESLWKVFEDARKRNFDCGENCLLALVSKCDDKIDFHWEREWRIVGDMDFEYKDVFCGICPEENISEFEGKFDPITFIDPYWNIYQILDKLKQHKSVVSQVLEDIHPADLPF